MVALAVKANSEKLPPKVIFKGVQQLNTKCTEYQYTRMAWWMKKQEEEEAGADEADDELENDFDTDSEQED